ncbi:MAG TPA: TRAP transporter small permease [Ramlibacter sp.]|jgi:TRAP-type C4-dicarboxylate transport system permease small subunit|nr:TRAP transporter small permease [Ramlibacter sp.]
MARLLLSSLPHQVLAALMVTGVALNGANVVGRYFFASPIFWAEEVMVYLMVWGIFVGLVAVTFDREHICMDLLSSRLPPRWLRVRDLLVTLVLFACCLFVAAQSWKVLTLFLQTGAVSASAGLPKAIPHAALLVGFALAALAAVVRIRGLQASAAAGRLPQEQAP